MVDDRWEMGDERWELVQGSQLKVQNAPRTIRGILNARL